MRRRLEDGPAPRSFGPYRLAQPIAVGGMAEVYQALWPQQAGADRAVVIKRLLPQLAADPRHREMFDLEASLGRRIQHPNVVATLDRGTQDGAPYLVMEYVFGVDLSRLVRWLQRGGRRLEVPLAVWIGRQILAGLDAVHSVTDDDGEPLDVVHRDVSPANVFLSVHGEVKLGDLGIARAAFQRQGASSVRAKGKLGYLPPEQVANRPIDQRGDVFSAAVVIAELLIGRPLFAGATEIGVLLAIRDGDISALTARAGELPVGLADVLVGALARRPEERTASAHLLSRGLARFAHLADADLRRALGVLVVAAHDAEVPSKDETSLAATVEGRGVDLEAPTPPLPQPGESLEALRETGALYKVSRRGADVGVYSLAEAVRALTIGELKATDQVAVQDGPPQLLAALPELGRYLPASRRTPGARRRVKMALTSELYELDGRSLLTVLVEAHLARERALLLCERGRVRKEIYIDAGVPVFVSSNRPEELLGEMLVEREIIARSELDMALAVMPRFEGRLGETLVALGLIDAVALFRFIGGQVRHKLLDVFTWEDGLAALYRGVEPPERGFPLELDPIELFEAGAERRIAAGFDTRSLERSTTDALIRAEDIRRDVVLPDRMAAILAACAGPRALSELEGFAATPDQARASVQVLLELGALRWVSRGGRR